MTIAAKTQFTQHVYDDCNPAFLRELREASGMDMSSLAKTACLSLAQVEQLEQGGDGLFYNLSIKRQAYKRLLMILGAEPPSVSLVQESVDVAHSASVTSAQALDHIIAMSHDLPRLVPQPLAEWWSRLPFNRYTWTGLVVALLAVWGGSVTQMANTSSAPVVFDSPPATSSAPVSPAVTDQATSSADVREVASERVVVASTPQEPASAAALPATSRPNIGECAFRSDPGPEVESPSPKKAGNYVYLISNTDTQVCVVDGRKTPISLELKAGEGRSVYGVAPWQVSGKSLAAVQFYFQGWRVMPPEGDTTRFMLVEKQLP